MKICQVSVFYIFITESHLFTDLFHNHVTLFCGGNLETFEVRKSKILVEMTAKSVKVLWEKNNKLHK